MSQSLYAGTAADTIYHAFMIAFPQAQWLACLYHTLCQAHTSHQLAEGQNYSYYTNTCPAQAVPSRSTGLPKASSAQ